jgi:hypothetical protein
VKELDDLMRILSPAESQRKQSQVEPELLTEGNSNDMEVLRLLDNTQAQKLAWVGDFDGASKSLRESMERALDKANVQDEADRISLKKKVWPRAAAGTVADLRDRFQQLTEEFAKVVQK